MAHETPSHLVDTWGNLKENPVFRRSTMPTSARAFLRNPIARALVLTVLALAMFEIFSFHAGQFFILLTGAAIFWTIVHAVQHYFTWVELSNLARTGTLEHYLNTGLDAADVCMGLIQPARISDQLAVLGLMAYFLWFTERHLPAVMVVFLLLIVLTVMNLIAPPNLFLPDVENYLRKRNPLALYFITFSAFVPAVVWFTIYWAVAFVAIPWGQALTGTNLGPQTQFLVAFGATWFISRFPVGWFQTWRLRRFRSRYRGVGDLLSQYLEQGERAN